jgi:hypothetical protein
MENEKKLKYWLLILLGMILFALGGAQLVSQTFTHTDYVIIKNTLITLGWWAYPLGSVGMIIVHYVYYKHIKPTRS